jgi:hypothetical protein
LSLQKQSLEQKQRSKKVSRKHVHAPVVGNEFVPGRPRLQAAAAGNFNAMVLPINHVATPQEPIPVYTAPHHEPAGRLFIEILHRYSFIVFTLLLLAIGSLGVEVGSHYWSAHVISRAAASKLVAKPPTIAGLNLSVPTAELPAKIDSITKQPVTLTVGDVTKPVA